MVKRRTRENLKSPTISGLDSFQQIAPCFRKDVKITLRQLGGRGRSGQKVQEEPFSMITQFSEKENAKKAV